MCPFCRCLEIGLGSWCANATINSTTLYGIQSQECQNVQGNNDDGECTLTSGDPGRTCSTCDDQWYDMLTAIPRTYGTISVLLPTMETTCAPSFFMQMPLSPFLLFDFLNLTQIRLRSCVRLSSPLNLTSFDVC